jgi:drug/metabolite transporter (DMT)-like permease
MSKKSALRGDDKRVYLYLGLTILFWSAAPAVAKVALNEINNFQLLFFNNIIGIISLSLCILLQKKTNLLFRYKKSDYAKLFGMGFLGLFLYYILIYGSFSAAPVGQANMLNYLWPIFLMIFSVLILKEGWNYKMIVAMLVSFAGAFIIFTGGNLNALNGQYAVGYLMAVFAAFCYGLFSALNKKLNYDKLTSVWIEYLASFVLITPTLLLVSNFVVPSSIGTILAILFLGGLSSSLGFVFWFKVLQSGATRKFANIIYLNPFLALIFVFFIDGQAVPVISLVGLLLIVGGIFLQLRKGNS